MTHDEYNFYIFYVNKHALNINRLNLESIRENKMGERPTTNAIYWSDDPTQDTITEAPPRLDFLNWVAEFFKYCFKVLFQMGYRSIVIILEPDPNVMNI